MGVDGREIKLNIERREKNKCRVVSESTTRDSLMQWHPRTMKIGEGFVGLVGLVFLITLK